MNAIFWCTLERPRQMCTPTVMLNHVGLRPTVRCKVSSFDELSLDLEQWKNCWTMLNCLSVIVVKVKVRTGSLALANAEVRQSASRAGTIPPWLWSLQQTSAAILFMDLDVLWSQFARNDLWSTSIFYPDYNNTTRTRYAFCYKYYPGCLNSWMVISLRKILRYDKTLT